MIRGQDVPRPSTLYCRKAPSRHALSFPLLLFFGLTRFVNVQCCAPLDHACSSAFIVCVCVCVCACVCVCTMCTMTDPLESVCVCERVVTPVSS